MSASPSILGYGLPPALQAVVDRHQQKRAKTTADRSLAKRLRDAVRQSDVQVTGVAVYVHDGAVSIYGTVRDAATREAILTVTTQQPGVRRIVDHLRIADA